jgi:hypothetical protein
MELLNLVITDRGVRDVGAITDRKNILINVPPHIGLAILLVVGTR